VEQADKPKVVLILIENEGKILLIRRRYPMTIVGLEWAFPGGVTHPGENEFDAAKREAKQEVGLDIEIKGKIFERKHQKIFITLAYFEGTIIDPDQKAVIGEPDEISEVKWVMAEKVLETFTSDTDPVIKNYVMSKAKK